MSADSAFYFTAGLITLFSLLVVTVPNLLHAALALIASFFVTAAFYLMCSMEFVALAQIMVYIGGVVILMVITILLTAQLGAKNLFPKTMGQRIWGFMACSALGASMFAAISRVEGGIVGKGIPATGSGDLETLGRRLLESDADGFLVPFELISILLLTALLGAVVVARKGQRINK
ncbi:MAG: NADH-quinone oxidoreductase subunit J [Desulfobulbaceae bacterium]|nr:NADH-quinone oxidoreductase subunit J [Desulfobulbaceae bacterium]